MLKTGTCQGCGGEFTRTEHRSKRDALKYCSRACAFEHVAQWRPKKSLLEKVERFCGGCGGSIGFGGRRLYCSPLCRRAAFHLRYPDALEKARVKASQRYRSGEAYKRDLSPRPCKECEETFTPVPGDGRRVFCSNACSEKNDKRTYEKKNPGRSMFRKRARRYGVEYTPGINWRRVMHRDGATCALCGHLVPAVSSRTDPWSPTVDHRVPMCRGGGHIWTNVQLAHRICNSYKRDIYNVDEIPKLMSDNRALTYESLCT
jgi:hypothetical protein